MPTVESARVHPDLADNTRYSFTQKWRRNPDLFHDVTMDPHSEVHQWLMRRNGWRGLDDMRAHLSSARRILDAGCGNGRVLRLLRAAAPSGATVVGFDVATADVARSHFEGAPGVEVHEGDLLGDLSHVGSCDFVYCQEVLHHTRDPRAAFGNLWRSCLAPGGTIAIYVYRRKAPLREYSDRFVHEQIRALDYDEAMEACRQVTAFGKALATQAGEVTVPDVEVLGIRAGTYPVQRLVYHFFLKCFYNEAAGDEASAVTNFDWFHPDLASHHEVGEVRSWFEDGGLEVSWVHEDEYGITMHGRRPA